MFCGSNWVHYLPLNKVETFGEKLSRDCYAFSLKKCQSALDDQVNVLQENFVALCNHLTHERFAESADISPAAQHKYPPVVFASAGREEHSCNCSRLRRL